MNCSQVKLLQRNFTLVELMVAVFIVSVSTLALYAVMTTARSSVMSSRLRLEAQRFSSDVAFQLLQMSKEDLEAKFSYTDIAKFDLSKANEWYQVPNANSGADVADLTPDLRKYQGFLLVNMMELRNPDTVSKLQNDVGCRLDVTVGWNFRNPLTYTTTVYEYFTE